MARIWADLGRSAAGLGKRLRHLFGDVNADKIGLDLLEAELIECSSRPYPM